MIVQLMQYNTEPSDIVLHPVVPPTTQILSWFDSQEFRAIADQNLPKYQS
jgi:hypothetical protein